MSRTKQAFAATMAGALCLLSTPALAAAGTITGTVTDEATSEPIDGISVCAFVIGTDINSCDNTNTSGEYAVIGLPTNSSYKVEFNSEPEYETEYYDDKPSWIKANSVAVVAGEVTAGIDAQLTGIPSGQITGTVTDEATSEPIDGISVCAFVIGTDINSCDNTNTSGEYAVIGLPTNSSYKVEFNGEPEYETEYYDDKPSWIKANSVAVVAGEVTAGIDAQLTGIPGKPAGAQIEPPSSSSSSFTNPASPLATDLLQPATEKRRACSKNRRGRTGKGHRKSSCSRRKPSYRFNAR